MVRFINSSFFFSCISYWLVYKLFYVIWIIPRRPNQSWLIINISYPKISNDSHEKGKIYSSYCISWGTAPCCIIYWTGLPVGFKPQVDMDLMRRFHLFIDERPLSKHNGQTKPKQNYFPLKFACKSNTNFLKAPFDLMNCNNTE